MQIHMVRHNRNGVGYCVRYENKGKIMVRFMGKFDLPVFFPINAFEKGYLQDLGIVDDTERNPLFQ